MTGQRVVIVTEVDGCWWLGAAYVCEDYEEARAVCRELTAGNTRWTALPVAEAWPPGARVVLVEGMSSEEVKDA